MIPTLGRLRQEDIKIKLTFIILSNSGVCRTYGHQEERSVCMSTHFLEFEVDLPHLTHSIVTVSNSVTTYWGD